MVAVHHETTVMHLAGEPSTEVDLGVSSLQDATSGRGEVRFYGEGVRRAVSLEGVEGRVSLTAPWPTVQVVELIRNKFVGRTVCVRDPFGGIVWAWLQDWRKTKTPSDNNELVDSLTLDLMTTTQDVESFL